MFLWLVAEIGGGWLVWQTIREKKPWFYAVAGEPLSRQQQYLLQCFLASDTRLSRIHTAAPCTNLCSMHMLLCTWQLCFVKLQPSPASRIVPHISMHSLQPACLLAIPYSCLPSCPPASRPVCPPVCLSTPPSGLPLLHRNTPHGTYRAGPVGCLVLCGYGFIPTLQPAEASFARVYAVYGGVFIVLSYAWGWLLDGDRPDIGDWVGAAIAVAGVLVAWFWPRNVVADGNPV